MEFRAVSAKVHDSLLYHIRALSYQKKLVRFLDQSQYWNKEKLKAFQFTEMKKLLIHCHYHVPYYRKLFREILFDPEGLRSLNEIRQIPLMNKKTVRQNFSALIATNIPKRLRTYHTTGGSTGVPLGFYFEKARSDIAERAFVLRSWSWVGYRPGDKVVQLRGHAIKSGRLYEFDKSKNILYMNTSLLNEGILNRFVRIIREFDPSFFHVYPSSAEILAKLMEPNNVEPFAKLSAIFCASENLYPHQRELIERIFRTRVFCHYGLAEHVASGTECENNSEYHFFPEHSLNWLIDQNGNEVSRKGQSGEIVGTSFYNYVMPLVNYKTGDMATLSHNEVCDCGRQFLLIEKISGRKWDFVRLSDGTDFPLVSFFLFPQLKGPLMHVSKMQLIQKIEGQLIIKIMKLPGYSLADESELKTRLSNRVNGRITLFFDYVSEIQSTERGKHKFFINKLYNN